jgi:hypothetical protein
MGSKVLCDIYAKKLCFTLLFRAGGPFEWPFVTLFRTAQTEQKGNFFAKEAQVQIKFKEFAQKSIYLCAKWKLFFNMTILHIKTATLGLNGEKIPQGMGS